MLDLVEKSIFFPLLLYQSFQMKGILEKICNKHCLQSAGVEQNIHIKKHNETSSVWYYRMSNHLLLFWILYRFGSKETIALCCIGYVIECIWHLSANHYCQELQSD